MKTLFSAVAILLACCGSSLAEVTNLPPTAVLLRRDATIQLGQKELKATDLTGPGKEVGGVSLAKQGDEWRIQAGAEPVEFKAEGFKENRVLVPAGQSVFVSPNWGRNILDFRTPASNTNRLLFSFHDGAQAFLGRTSTGRVDLLKDESYYFWSRGRVGATNADGESLKLGPVFPPLFGGPLGSRTQTNGAARMGRLLPTVPVLMSAFDGKEVTIRVGEEMFQLKIGERKAVVANNGSEIGFYLNPSTRTVEWDITKGAFRLNVGGFECWKALGLADEAGSQQWDAATQSIDVRNFSKDPMHSILVMLAARVNVAVFPKATFQYSFMGDCLNFATSGVGGPILLYNDDQKQVVALQTENLLFRTGLPLNRRSNDSTKQVLRLGWNTPANLEVKAGGETLNVPANMEKVAGVGIPVNQDLAVLAGLVAPDDTAADAGGRTAVGGTLAGGTGTASTGQSAVVPAPGKGSTPGTPATIELDGKGVDSFLKSSGLEGKVFVSHLKEDEITVTATQGSYILRPDFLDNVTIELREGESVSFSTSQNGKAYTIRSASNGGTPLISFGNGGSTALNGSVTVIRGGAGGNGGTTVFQEGAGAGGGSTVSVPPGTGGGSTGLGAGPGTPTLPADDRVPQPPVSPAR